MLMPRLSTHPLKPLKSYHPPPPLIIRKTMLKEIEELFEAHMKIFNKKVEGNKPENGQNPMIFFFIVQGYPLRGDGAGPPLALNFLGPTPCQILYG